jgi:hypothetical protein
MPQSRVEIFCNECTRSTLLDPKLMFWRILYYSGVFGTIVCLTKLGAKWAELVQKVCFHKVASKFFATNAPDPPHCIQNSCFSTFRTIWVHFEQFGLLTRLGAKRAELVEKFVPWSRVGISSNYRTRSTPLDHKLMFWCISYYLDAFGTIVLWNSVQNGPNWCKSFCHEVTFEFPARTHPSHPFVS